MPYVFGLTGLFRLKNIFRRIGEIEPFNHYHEIEELNNWKDDRKNHDIYQFDEAAKFTHQHEHVV